jgi:Raf kinase inhibitor-like YbhB/YbcL family protein
MQWALTSLKGLLMAATASFAFTVTPFFAGGQPGGRIEKEFTCEGPDVSPPMAWAAPPSGTQSLTLIVDDPDAPGGLFTHWVLYGILPEARGMRKGQLPPGASEGINDFGTLGYRGPCPPPGKPHRYVFTLYALDEAITWPQGSSVGEIKRAMNTHTLAKAQVTGTFGR